MVISVARTLTPAFEAAATSGLKHFYIEQDNAADSGDSMASAKASYEGLMKVLA